MDETYRLVYRRALDATGSDLANALVDILEPEFIKAAQAQTKSLEKAQARAQELEVQEEVDRRLKRAGLVK